MTLANLPGNFRVHQKGISLLEMLLVIALGASIIIMSVKYFNVTTRNTRVEEALIQIQQITDASYEWLRTNRQANFKAVMPGQEFNLQILINLGLITPNTKKQIQKTLLDPWGGEITVSHADDPNYIQISLQKIPKLDCHNLTRRLQNINRSQIATHCDATKNTFYGEF